MKTCLLAALVGLAISFAVPSFAQLTNTPDPQLRQKLLDVIAKHADAMNKNDAAAAAACFTEDGVYVTDRGPINGRDAIQKWYADLFQNVQFSNHVITVDPIPLMLWVRLAIRCGQQENGTLILKVKTSVQYKSRDTGQLFVRAMIGRSGC
jgi:ketosteroid isomerase-like protein